jgi:hypothetical protein
MEDKLRKYIRKYAKEAIEEMKSLKEISTSDGAGPYLTPMAFIGSKDGGKNRMRQISQQLGYKLTPRGEKDLSRSGDRLQEIAIAYIADLKLMTEDVSILKPHQQLGSAISEINSQLFKIERAIIRQRNFKLKENVQSGTMWKKTMRQLVRLESRLLNIANQLREIRN